MLDPFAFALERFCAVKFVDGFVERGVGAAEGWGH